MDGKCPRACPGARPEFGDEQGRANLGGGSCFGAGGDLQVAHELAAIIEQAELFLYRGDRHLFADRGLPDYDEAGATLLKQRVLSFLDRTG